ncbi:unnamed protein product [Meloidogyne enterolobii]|uniref:Uncharacterized protein n=1 Tax=Meloidogyne enterolobii TaxID=390850 RepID=A0ACB1B6X6_MELEN
MKFSQLFVLLIIALQFLVAQGLIYDAKAAKVAGSGSGSGR